MVLLEVTNPSQNENSRLLTSGGVRGHDSSQCPSTKFKWKTPQQLCIPHDFEECDLVRELFANISVAEGHKLEHDRVRALQQLTVGATHVCVQYYLRNAQKKAKTRPV